MNKCAVLSLGLIVCVMILNSAVAETESSLTSNQSDTTTVKVAPLDTTTLVTEESLTTLGENTTTTSTTSTTTTTTTTTTSTTTTTTTTTTPKPTTESEFDYSGYCTCDLSPGSCDTNCCCDQDCDPSDSEAFSFCIEQKPRQYDPRYCFNEQFIFWNSSQYVIEEQNNNMFCIYYDNQKDSHDYLERPATENVTLFNLLDSRHRKYQWESEAKKTTAKSMNHYISGKPIWIQLRSPETFSFLELPVSYNSEFCQTSSPIKYMMDYQSSCVIDTHQADCALDGILNANSYFLFNVVTSPGKLINSTNDTGDIFIPITAHLCSKESCEKVETFPKPTKQCENIAKSVKYVVYHDGVQGIESVDLFVHIQDSSSGEKHFRQFHEYVHFWSRDNATLETSLSPLSGNPGYLVGRPVRVGLYSASETEPIILEDNQLLSTFDIGEGGLCDLEGGAQRIPLLFGQNKRIGCSVYLNKTTLSEKCSELKTKSFYLMVGVKYSNLKSVPRYVATFGNSDTTKPGDWVKILHKNEPDYQDVLNSRLEKGLCPGIVKSLHIEVLHSDVGSFSNPQTKIVGVLYNFGKLSDERFTCIGLACNHGSNTQRLDFSVSVSFTDVTGPASPVFAAIPVLQAKFPHDFFYPFVSSSTVFTISSQLTMSIVVIFSSYFC